MPKLEKPVKIHFIWVSTKDDKRDPDNIASACKYILDEMQIVGKLKNDNRKNIIELNHSFAIGADYSVILEIEELKAFEMEEENVNNESKQGKTAKPVHTRRTKSRHTLK